MFLMKLMILIGSSWLIILAAHLLRCIDLCLSHPTCSLVLINSITRSFVNIQIISMKNKANKTKQRTNHTSGRKSFHAVSYDAVRFQFNLPFAYCGSEKV